MIRRSKLKTSTDNPPPASIEFTATELVVGLADGRRIATPLDWYPRLQRASPFLDARVEPGHDNGEGRSFLVVAGLDPAIQSHRLHAWAHSWMPGSSPGMTMERVGVYPLFIAG